MTDHPDDVPMDRAWELSRETMGRLQARAAERALLQVSELLAPHGTGHPSAR